MGEMNYELETAYKEKFIEQKEKIESLTTQLAEREQALSIKANYIQYLEARYECGPTSKMDAVKKLTLATEALDIADDYIQFEHERRCNFDSIVPECNCGTERDRAKFQELMGKIKAVGE